MNNDKKILLSEYSLKNIIPPSRIRRGSNKICLWNCSKCSSEYSMDVKSRTFGQNCPYCRGLRVNNSNCLWTTHPYIAKLLKDKNVGYKVTHGSSRKEEFVCEHCQNVEKKEIRLITSYGFSCSKCSDGISYPEKIVISLLNQLNIHFERQKSFKWSRNILAPNEKIRGTKLYDFYIPSLDMIIETHGQQHYVESFMHVENRRTLKEEQENDQLKEKVAKENGIAHYIELDCKKSNIAYVRNSILNSKLSSLLNLNNIDWQDCDLKACKSMVKTLSELWQNKTTNVYELGMLLNICDSTVRNYLKKGTELGWCNYNPKQSMKKNSRKIIQLSKSGEFIKMWNSMTQASESLSVNKSSISQATRGVIKSAGGYKWMYKEDYDQYIKQVK